MLVFSSCIGYIERMLDAAFERLFLEVIWGPEYHPLERVFVCFCQMPEGTSNHGSS